MSGLVDARALAGLTGYWAMTRLVARRERITLSVWALAIGGLSALFTDMSVAGLPTQADVVQETAMMAGSPGLRLMGLPSGATVGGYAMVRGYLTLAVLAAVMSLLAVVRHTRQDEEAGRGELLGSGVVGRHARLAAAVTVTLAADLVVVAGVALGMIVNGMPVAGSLVAGCAVGAVGVFFTGVAAITTQLVTSARGARSLAGALLGVAFLLSGTGNMLGSVDASGLRVVSAWPAWLSPIGWGQQMRPFDDDLWWPVAIFVATSAALMVVAAVLASRRDFGRGLLPERRGPEGSRRLRGPFGLIWRLQRGAFLAWAVAIFGFGIIFGSLAGEVTDLEGSAREWYQQMGGSDQLADAYQASIFLMVGMALAVYAVQALLRMRTDEVEGRAEPVISSAVGRARWAVLHVLTVTAGATVLTVVVALGMTVTAEPGADGRWGELRSLVGAGLVQIPSVMVIGGVVVAAIGLIPRRAAAVSWAVLLVAFGLGPLFGPDLRVSGWLLDLSPFTHTPRVPAVELTVAPVLALVGVFVVLVVGGLVSGRRRDLALPT